MGKKLSKSEKSEFWANYLKPCGVYSTLALKRLRDVLRTKYNSSQQFYVFYNKCL